MRVRFNQVSVLAIVAAILAPGIAHAQSTTSTMPAPGAAPASQETGIQDIVVTAQRREQNLQRVPISITAITAQGIAANRIQDVRDLSSVAPSLTIRESPGGAGIPQYTIRGVYTSNASAGTDRGVAMYVDGVYFQNSSGSIFQLADIERIEVLKGPQGTLFGRNATGGAISITTKDPAGEFHVHQELTGGNYGQFRSKTRVDLPSFGPLSLSATYLHNQRDGDVRNLGAGTTWNFGPLGNRTSPKRLGDHDVNAFAAAAKLDLGTVTAVYKFDYSTDHYSPDAVVPSYVSENPLISNPLVGLIFGPGGNALPPLTDRRPGAVNNAFTTPGYTRAQGHNLTVTWRPSDVISFKNIFAYRKVLNYASYQFDGLGGLTNALAPIAGAFPGTAGVSSSPTDPFVMLGTLSETKENQWSNETTMNVKTAWFDLTAGYIHFHDHDVQGPPTGLPSIVQFMAAPGHVIPNIGTLPSRINVNSDAWYVQPEFHINRQLDVVLGARITKDEKDGIDNSLVQTVPTLTVPEAELVNSIPYKVNYHNSKPTFMAGLNYRPLNNVLTYFKFSTGYISGGQIAGLAYKPETVQSYEVGLKTDLLDHHLRFNLAVYDAHYDNLQLSVAGVSSGRPELAAAPIVVFNAGRSRARGFELETTLVPIRGLTLTGNVGYTDFKFLYLNPMFAVYGEDNVSSDYARPRWTGQVAAQYETLPLSGLGDARVLARLDADFRSKESFTYYYPGAAQGDPNHDLLNAASVGWTWLLNTRLALTDINVFNKKAEVALWGRNILNNKNPSQLSGPLFAFGYAYEQARTYGIDVTFDF